MRLSERLSPANATAADRPAVLVAPRRLVVVLTLVVGTVLLAATLKTSVTSASFTMLGAAVAAVWIVGSLAAGPVPLGGRSGLVPRLREVLVAAAVGVALYGLFVVAALIAHHIPVLSEALHHLLTKADHGALVVILIVAALSAIGEEVFFRGSLYSAIGSRHPVVWSTVAYTLVTAVTANLALVAAAAALGTVTAIERRATRGVLTSMTTHVVWSTLMILALPR